ncbi:uncharacterized protein LOC144166770 [Haemaphysalis longicornis]
MGMATGSLLPPRTIPSVPCLTCCRWAPTPTSPTKGTRKGAKSKYRESGSQGTFMTSDDDMDVEPFRRAPQQRAVASSLAKDVDTQSPTGPKPVPSPARKLSRWGAWILPQPEPVPSPRKSTGRSPEVSGSRHSGKRSRAKSPQKARSSQQPSKRHLKKGRAPVKRWTGYGALQEMVRPQLSTRLLLLRRPFERLVRAILRKVARKRLFIQAIALQVLQEAAEAILVAVLQGANALAQHSKRVTLMDRDMAYLLQSVRRDTSLV